jgi:hypothetical protein
MQNNGIKPLPRPAFLITVDTEGDNLWNSPRQITTNNARFLPRFQTLCEKHGLKPTWLVNYEMAECPEFVEFVRDVARRGAGEIGMHLHAWNSPPLVPLTENDMRYQPYLIEYPEAVMRDKIRFITDLLEERFSCKMLSHRAGRWGFNAIYARLLVEHGYKVDTSITPHVSWAKYLGDPKGSGGPDFRHFPELPYFVDLNQICQPGDSSLLEVPLTVIKTRYSGLQGWLDWAPNLIRRISRRLLPPVLEMVPRDKKHNFRHMQAILRQALKQGRPCVVLATHSSELMPGGSPFFPTAESIERLYNRLEILFSAASKFFHGATLSELREGISDEGLRVRGEELGAKCEGLTDIILS